MAQTRRTRFAPSPTGFMHIGNLRSALYAWLLTKSQNGKFILRIEDTDQERLVEGATEVIYKTLATCGLSHDEGPDVGGDYGPYIQSERLPLYKKYAEELVASGHAYRCFCSKERLEALAGNVADGEGEKHFGYDRHCRNLSEEEIAAHLAQGDSCVIRQKMPLEGSTSFQDLIYGEISVENKELEDQILLKSDGFPTYNFANVVDDHLMGITHVVRGSEYLSSTPKYNLLYEAFGWEKPEYIHLPLILGTDGKKLSKRHGATSFEELREEGYLTEAIINYIAFLGWSNGEDTREIYSLDELRQVFDEHHINKAPAVFDYQKLRWYNAEYLKAMSPEAYKAWLQPYAAAFLGEQPYDPDVLAEILQPRLEVASELPQMLAFLKKPSPYTVELFRSKKQKLTPELSLSILREVLQTLQNLPAWSREAIHESLMALGPAHSWKTGQVMGPPRLALSGQTVTPGGAIELIVILGKAESLARLQAAIRFLEAEVGKEQ